MPEVWKFKPASPYLTRVLNEGTEADRKLLSVRRYRMHGYEIRTEEIDGSSYGCPNFTIKSAYTDAGDYVGDPRMAYRLCAKKGIFPQRAEEGNNICTIGYQPAENKWYGWSHRAIYGFSVGDTVKEGDVLSSVMPVGWKANTIDDAKAMAKAFAKEVG